MERRLTTADVPAKFLGAVFLTGRVPWRVAPEDSRVSYCLYVPPSKYSTKYTADATEEQKNNGKDERLPLVVWVHGTGRDTSALTTDLAAFAEANGCAVMAPLFPANIDGPHDLDAYKLLQSRTLRSDKVLLAILGEVAVVWPGIATEKVYLGGFSGGGQFAHRFLYLYPERLAAVAVGAPGSTTKLDNTQAWPVGIQDVESVFGKTVDKAAISKVAIQLAIGSEDSKIHGGAEFWDWLREMRAKEAALKKKAREAKGIVDEDDNAGEKDKSAKSHMPTSFSSRLDGIQEIQKLWKEDGIESTLTIVDGFAHESVGVRPHILEFFKSRLEADKKQ